MPSVYELKPAFQRLLRPLARRLAGAGATANQVTVAAFLLSAAGGAAIAFAPDRRWPLLALPAVLFVRMAANALDGMLAREHGQASPLGALLNELGDVLSDAVLYLPLGLVPGVDGRWLVAAATAALATEVAGLAALHVGARRRYDGPMGKSDRALAFGLVALLLGAGVPPGRWLDLALAAVLLLALLTIANRMRRALAEAAR
ncbi:MAG TPA: CDP-alcohol phosphatidyltransferase family protein [Thermoanaerobaculia bacterium]|nr:CDP-alcohol phosphatidyltransferase family protein [Thermoanaerobaculia bacterium]